jgi:myo-inositol-1(or 4)-monophosphatase
MGPVAPDPERLLALADRAARAAGAELRARAGRPEGVGSKSTRTDLVSDADRAAEEAILATIRAARPDDAVLAEEGGAAAGGSGLRWVVDPLDGTVNYLWGIPHYAVSIAVADAHGPLVGLVHDPCRDESFHALRGRGAWHAGVRLRVNRPTGLDDAIVATGFNYSSDERRRQADPLTRVLPAVRDLRRFGAAALDLAWLAAGRVDAYLERGLQEWDWAAGALLVEEAGGGVTLLAAAGPRPAGVAAAHPSLLAPLCALFGEAEEAAAAEAAG